MSEWIEKLPQKFDCNYDGDITRCDKDCAKLGVCKRRTTAPAVIEWKMVPVEPTPEMLQAAQQEEWGGINADVGTAGFPMYRKFYRAMLSAAPQPEGETSAAEALKTLSDPINLHRNLLRGYPARLTREQLLHLAGGPQPTEREGGMSAPEEVTVTSTGSLRVDPSKLLQTAEAQAQLKALKGLNIVGEGMKPTPRTDAEWPEGSFVDGKDALKFARDLERQLSKALEREAKLRQELAIEFRNSDRLAKALSALVTEYEGLPRSLGYEFTHLPDARTALALHESGDEPTYTDCPIHGRHEGDCPRC